MPSPECLFRETSQSWRNKTVMNSIASGLLFLRFSNKKQKKEKMLKYKTRNAWSPFYKYLATQRRLQFSISKTTRTSWESSQRIESSSYLQASNGPGDARNPQNVEGVHLPTNSTGVLIPCSPLSLHPIFPIKTYTQ